MCIHATSIFITAVAAATAVACMRTSACRLRHFGDTDRVESWFLYYACCVYIHMTAMWIAVDVRHLSAYTCVCRARFDFETVCIVQYYTIVNVSRSLRSLCQCVWVFFGFGSYCVQYKNFWIHITHTGRDTRTFIHIHTRHVVIFFSVSLSLSLFVHTHTCMHRQEEDMRSTKT